MFNIGAARRGYHRIGVVPITTKVVGRCIHLSNLLCGVPAHRLN